MACCSPPGLSLLNLNAPRMMYETAPMLPRPAMMAITGLNMLTWLIRSSATMPTSRSMNGNVLRYRRSPTPSMAGLGTPS